MKRSIGIGVIAVFCLVVFFGVCLAIFVGGGNKSSTTGSGSQAVSVKKTVPQAVRSTRTS